MMNLIQLLIYKLETIDGFRGTALPIIDGYLYKDIIKVYSQVLMRYKIMKLRMKISCSAFEQKKSVLELFLFSILKTHQSFFQQGLIPMTMHELKSQ